MKTWLSAFFMVMLFASSAIAENYIVKRGDTLLGIAKRHGVTVGVIQSANPRIKNINHIQPNWKLEIPTGNQAKVRTQAVSAPKFSGEILTQQKKVWDGWIDPGANKYWKGKPEGLRFLQSMDKGMQILGYSEEDRKGLISEIANARWEETYIYHAYKGGLVKSEKDGTQYRMIKMLGNNSRGQIEVITGPNGVIPSWKNEEEAYPARLYRFGDVTFLLPWVCDNPTLIVKVGAPPSRVAPPQEYPPIDLIIPPVAKTPPKECKNCDKWDWYGGAFNYHSRIQGNDNKGDGWWTKFRYRPICIEPEKNSLGIKRIGLGAFGFLAGGDGIAAKYYYYDWRKAVGGGTAKIEAQHSDYDSDLGIGKLWNEGSWMGKEDRDQIDDIFLASAHANVYRDDPNAVWFKKYELNVEYQHPFHTRLKKGKTAIDNRAFEATYTQWIYAAEIGEDNSLVVSPGVNLGFGYEWSADDKDFIKGGSAVEVASYGNVIGGVSIYNYKFQGKGQWHPISGYVSIDGSINAWKASHITGVSAKDLEGLQGQDSKLLANPADFL